MQHYLWKNLRHLLVTGPLKLVCSRPKLLAVLSAAVVILLHWSSMQEAADNAPEFALSEIAKHNHAGSAWMIYKGAVLDITNFLEEHPGGDEVLLEVAGKDGTAAFMDIGHSKDAESMIKDFVIGRVKKGESAPEEESVFKTRRRFGLYVCLPTAAILALVELFLCVVLFVWQGMKDEDKKKR